ncbi:hypothetical protein [Persephonella sp.]
MEICGLNFPDIFFERHYQKRLEEGIIKNKNQYTEVVKATIKNADRYFVVRQFSDCKDKIVFYFNKWTVWILMEERRIITAFHLRYENIEEFFEERNIKYGLSENCEKETYIEVRKNENDKYAKFIRTVQDRC